MAEDSFELNFELGPEPLKPQVKFTGGRWRDRKRAENSARRLATSRPSTKNDSHSEAPRSSKRRRVEDENAESSLGLVSAVRTASSRREPESRSGDPFERTTRRNNPADATKTSRQVVSRLFSYNPQKQTKGEDAVEWKAPQPTNAPLADVASFGSLTLSSRLVDELAKMNLHRPTAIQQKVVPHLLSKDSDAFVQAETGSGKTFSYLLPIIHRVLLLSASGSGSQVHRDSGIFAIVISPTRELAKQVHTVLEQLLRPFPWLVSTAICGGESKKAEKARIRKGVNFLVATPGRLADHIDNTKALVLATTRWLILDEGDRLMELGFERDLEKIITALRKVPIATAAGSGTKLDSLPERRVTVLCSATMRLDVQKLGEMSLTDATLLAADKTEDDGPEGQLVHKAPAQLHQSYIIVPSKLRLVTLISHLRSVFSRRGRIMKAIVFMSCADSVDFHYALLSQPDGAAPSAASSKDAELIAKTVCKASYLPSAASPEIILHRMHGSLNQPTRTATLRSFSACELPSVLITTDVSSRGLDIPSVEMIVEYDPAFSFADHIHRIGRTARAGRPGDAVLFLLPGSEEGYVELVKSSCSPSSLSYESVLQKGLMAKFEFPIETASTPVDGSSYHEKAEALQLHIEQRLLAEAKLLELARSGYRSQIRAYATHVKEERAHFDMSQLHLGHAAKSFGLREAPGGIGAGIERKTKKGAKEKKTVAEGQKPSRDVLIDKSMKLMNAADEFNIG
ncbi:hypothetical protein L249_3690 [Ophiocordyceps polyrhachis-furcata BCC 54312]|uniref:ATP-dependent RNA helicase n=1 Tax=Ophiocordyceps polyrhachis-furcata BCC 54312 TaxID=1330021 RepID=A0A367L4L5_9HYPO|nr:hypothetical protein L249_3690 [Ophiocordyceps polyrhachis-furcata BCC 54312]